MGRSTIRGLHVALVLACACAGEPGGPVPPEDLGEPALESGPVVLAPDATATTNRASIPGVGGAAFVEVHAPHLRPEDAPRFAPPVVAAAGDVSWCHPAERQTAAIIEQLFAPGGPDGVAAMLGDAAYPDGSPADYANCYDPSWGRFRARTRPAIGNHEYLTGQAAPYFDYFGDLAGPRGKGFYSYDLGSWHVVVLNSNGDELDVRAGSEQEQWLRADLAASHAKCTLAYWHHPLFTSGAGGPNPGMRPIFEALYDAGADVVLSAHEHDYERFAPQDPQGHPDAERGIRAFVVGTGGKSLRAFAKTPARNSEVRQSAAFGVLVLTLKDGGYDWEWRGVPGTAFQDRGSGTCH